MPTLDLSPKDDVKVTVTVCTHYSHGPPGVDSHVDKHIRMELAEKGVYQLLCLPLGEGWVKSVGIEAVVAEVHVWTGVILNNMVWNAHFPSVGRRGKDTEVASPVRGFLHCHCVPLVEPRHQTSLVPAKDQAL